MVKLLGMRQETKFFDLFEESVSNSVVFAAHLIDFLDHYEDVEVKVLQFTELEHKGDLITHQIMENLHRSFITPLDREDIYLLAQYLDDIVDLMEGAAVAMHLYHIPQPTPRTKVFARIIALQVEELTKAIPLLRHRNQMKRILEHGLEVKRLEKEADSEIRLALAELFDNCLPALDVIKWREIYEHLETAADRCLDVANVLEGIVLKYG